MTRTILAALIPALAVAQPAWASGDEPAGGAALGEVALATAGATVLTAALIGAGMAHRSGRLRALARLAAFAERSSGMPGWAALPSSVATVSLVTAVLGMYWDIALHIDVGRDEGPLANPAHYLILAGLFGIFAAGYLAMVLPHGRPSSTAVRLGRGWHAPLGGVLICACGAFALLGFPLDDVWHRLFGQDVTLWGPTHLMLIGGASMTLVGMAVLMVEGRRANAAAVAAPAERSWVRRARAVGLSGGLLIGLSTFQAEFDFGVPQFRFVLAPMLVMLAAGVGLVAVRLSAGRGAALGAVAFFLVVRGALALTVGPVLGQSTPHMPLYVAEALVVELVGLAVSRRRPLAFGALSGLGIGTVGLAAEWGWSHLFMPIPWPAALWPEAALLGFACALAGALVGAWVGTRLRLDGAPRNVPLRAAAVAASALVAGLVGYALHKPAGEPVRAAFALEQVAPAPERSVHATIALEPRDVAEGAEWLTVTAWQGGGLVVDRLRRVGAGRYRTTRLIPVHGSWKALLRLHDGNRLRAVPIRLPRDAAIPAEAVPAPVSFARSSVADHEILQREGRDAAPALTVLAYAAVAAIALALLALLAWGLHRLAAGAERAAPQRPTRPAVAGRAAPAPLPR